MVPFGASPQARHGHPTANESAGAGRDASLVSMAGKRGSHGPRAVVLFATVVASAVAGCATQPAARPVSVTRQPSPPVRVHTSQIAATRATCPLTGAPAPGGVVPQRPALAIKVGNNPTARPQSGLGHADLVIEEPIEGLITRLLAVYQCQQAPAVGPVRSTRWVDSQVLAPLGAAGFGFAGGITPDEARIAASGLKDLNFFLYYGAYFRISSRVAPDNLYTATATLWALDASHTPPAPLFSYSAVVPASPQVAAVTLTWSPYYSAGWVWSPGTQRWLREVNGLPASSASGVALSAANVIVERVATYPGPYAEDSRGDVGVRSVTVGQGTALVLRDGHAIAATWQRPTLAAPTTYRDAATGAPLTLTPGNTWLELLPTSGSVTVSGG